MYTNFAKKFKGIKHKDHFFACDKVTTMVDFNANMEKEFNDKE